MLCILLVAGLDTPLETQLLNNEALRGLPRALLPVAGKPIIDYWWEMISQCKEISQVIVVTNAKHYKHFERWATAHGLPYGNVINNGCTSAATLPGACYDLHCAITRATAMNGIAPQDVCIIAGDSLFYKEFDLSQAISCYSETSEEGSLILSFALDKVEKASKLGILTADHDTKVVTCFKEKPKTVQAPSYQPILTSPVFYIFNQQTLSNLKPFVDQQLAVVDGDALETSRRKLLSCGYFLEYVHSRVKLYCMRLPSGFSLVGLSAGLEDYIQLDRTFRKLDNRLSPAPLKDVRKPPTPSEVEVEQQVFTQEVHSRAYARIGAMGNPSDGFFGKTLSFTISNFHADVYLRPSAKLRLTPHPLFDPCEFGSIGDLQKIARREGYNGGMRLLLGTCKKFFDFCVQQKIALPKRNFTVQYDTNIPRQVGLAGSSAIITAFFKALMCFYGLTEVDISKPAQANFVLSVETDEMGINAGLQDRVVQAYEGLVYMDFNKELMEAHGFGEYTNLSIELLPKGLFFLAYSSDPSDSGKIHSNVKERYLENDPEVVEAMKQFGEYAKEAKDALLNHDLDSFRSLMDKNFDLRRELYSDEVIGIANLEMISLARSLGASCKFPGSGGAIVGLVSQPQLLEKAREEFQSRGYVFVPIEPVERTHIL